MSDASPELSLAVQYAVVAPELPRWRIRRWATRALAAALDDGLTQAARVSFSLRLVGKAEGLRLNRDFRGRDYATNVLTFEYGTDPDGVTHGDIVICLPVLKQEARAQKKTLLHHAAHLTIHGCLHALGYDHIDEADAQRMEALETRVLADLGISDPYA
ncbi:MAG: rRNA maturation RNase YbeY [Comamonadaceae bacterium]|nr:MAG: rRNA maturation RNase YbeY [Comamonadaceae bacterium]